MVDLAQQGIQELIRDPEKSAGGRVESRKVNGVTY